MNLVDEQQRALPDLTAAAGLVEYLLEVGDAGEDRRDLLKIQIGRLRQQPRYGGLPGAGRPPEHERAERTRGQHARQRAVGSEQMILAHHLIELLWTQPIGQRPWRIFVEACGGK